MWNPTPGLYTRYGNVRSLLEHADDEMLFFFGTPPVKGFATTLVIGLLTNLFTSVFVSRVAFDWEFIRQGRNAELSIGMLK
jgi:preprotein translocase subunit SecD